jgi:class 3 adenylate cyclase
MKGRQDDHFEGAILAVDAVGYSRLMGKDEEATLRRLHYYRALIKDLVEESGGRVFGIAGDSEMALFPEAVQAVRCGLQIQDKIEKWNAVLPRDSRMPVRIGLSFGQVRVEDDGVFGDEVNVAARVENFGKAGEVCISEAVFEQVKDDRVWGFDCFGDERFKNIDHPVRVYRVRTDSEAIGQVIQVKRRQPRPGRVWRAAAAVGVSSWRSTRGTRRPLPPT